VDFRARSGEFTVDDVREWAIRVDELDELDAATTLWAATSFLGPGPGEGPQVAVARALNFLLLGRPHEAAAALVESPCVRGDRPDVDAALDATSAALGEEGAWIRLVNGVAQFPGVLTILLLAGAGECRGDHTTADSAWLALRDDIGRRSGLVLARAAVADITRAIGSNAPNARGRAVYRNAVALSGVRGGSGRDPRWALEAIERLESRDDSAGARLLAETLTVMVSDPPQRLVAESARRTPQKSMRRYRTWMTVGVLAAVAFLWLGILWVALIAIARVLIDRFVRVPGFTLDDGRAWRSLRPRIVGAGYGPGATALSGWAAFAIVILVALASIPFAAAVTNANQSPLLLMSIWLTALVGVPIVAVFAVQAVWRWWKVTKARSAAQRLTIDSTTDASRCRCWNNVWFSDDSARLYLRQHLLPVDLEGDLRTVAAVGANGTWVGECPVSHIRWLAWQTTPEGGFLAIRGAQGVAPQWATSTAH
jgi:hypothetical protein